MPPRKHATRYRKQRISQAMRQDVARRLGFQPGAGFGYAKCHYCATPILVDWTNELRVRFVDTDGRSTPELDHVIALANGGPHDSENLVLSCLSCNRTKGSA